eukprot:PhM_4_TR18832/c2_g1_i2/m.39798
MFRFSLSPLLASASRRNPKALRRHLKNSVAAKQTPPAKNNQLGTNLQGTSNYQSAAEERDTLKTFWLHIYPKLSDGIDGTPLSTFRSDKTMGSLDKNKLTKEPILRSIIEEHALPIRLEQRNDGQTVVLKMPPQFPVWLFANGNPVPLDWNIQPPTPALTLDLDEQQGEALCPAEAGQPPIPTTFYPDVCRFIPTDERGIALSELATKLERRVD